MDNSVSLADERIFASIGLTHSPFPVTPDTSHYFCPERIESHLLELMHGIHTRKGFLLFTADVGLGKSTMSRYLIENLEGQKTNIALVLNTFLQGLELLQTINEDFGIQVEGGVKEQLDGLNAYLLNQYTQGYNCLIIIDDAQNLTMESLEMIRLISNLEINTHKLVQILLIAQPEIMDSLNKPEIRQLKSRIALYVALSPLSEEEVKEYVVTRLNSAGNMDHLSLSSGAVKALWKLTKGYPRRINLIMDRVLYALIVSKQTKVDKKTVLLANQDLEDSHKAISSTFPEMFQVPRPSRVGFSIAASLALVALPLVAWQFAPTDWLEKIELQASSAQQLFIDKPETVDLEVTLVKITEPRDNSSNLKPTDAELETGELKQTKNARDIELLKFLASYGQETLYEPIEKAILQQDWHKLDTLVAQSGWRLLIDDKPFNQQDLNTFKVVSNTGQEHWLLLWEPELEFKRFYFGMKSEEVRTLQQLLKQQGFLNSRVDATIGSKTMYALANFQRKNDIEPTGHADTLTLYYLTQK